jgi:hypothetical protein
VTFTAEDATGNKGTAQAIVTVAEETDKGPAASSGGGSLGFWSMILLGLGLMRRTIK